jgi:hypothetical protein
MAKKELSPIEKANKATKLEAKKRKANSNLIIFNSLLSSVGMPPAITEHKFHPTRLWRMDYAWPEYKLALEIEGGAFIGGRHTSGMGFVADMVKYNEAASLGWIVLRCQPKDLLKIEVLDWITKCITLRIDNKTLC